MQQELFHKCAAIKEFTYLKKKSALEDTNPQMSHAGKSSLGEFFSQMLDWKLKKWLQKMSFDTDNGSQLCMLSSV